MRETLTIWTIGYGGRSKKNLLEILKEHNIRVVVDVRSFPTSKVEDFKRENMAKWLSENSKKYVWLGKELGGYRRGGYEKYMKSDDFKRGIEKLIEIAKKNKTCILCLERNPKYCHRRFIAAYLTHIGIKVVHILKKDAYVCHISDYAKEGEK